MLARRVVVNDVRAEVETLRGGQHGLRLAAVRHELLGTKAEVGVPCTSRTRCRSESGSSPCSGSFSSSRVSPPSGGSQRRRKSPHPVIWIWWPDETWRKSRLAARSVREILHEPRMTGDGATLLRWVLAEDCHTSVLGAVGPGVLRVR